MIRGSVLFPATSDVAVAAKPELDLSGWPAWMREALAVEPEAEAPESRDVGIEPDRTVRANIRKLTRMPSGS